MFDFAQAKADARRTVHTTFGVQAFYTDDSVATPIEFRARFHNKMSRPIGGLQDGDGYSGILEGIDRIVFIPEDINGIEFTPRYQGEVTIPNMMPGVTFVLDSEYPVDGPVGVAWMVSRK